MSPDTLVLPLVEYVTARSDATNESCEGTGGILVPPDGYSLPITSAFRILQAGCRKLGGIVMW